MSGWVPRQRERQENNTDDPTQIACILQDSEYYCRYTQAKRLVFFHPLSRSALVGEKLILLSPSASMKDIENLYKVDLTTEAERKKGMTLCSRKNMKPELEIKHPMGFFSFFPPSFLLLFFPFFSSLILPLTFYSCVEKGEKERRERKKVRERREQESCESESLSSLCIA